MVLYGSRTINQRDQIYDLLSRSAQAYWGLNQLPAVERHPEGKPWFPSRAELEFNLSHSGTMGLCALSCHPVGVDIQIIKQWRPGLPQRVCSQEELDWLDRQQDQWGAFTVLWALKESRVKQSGRGLRDPIRQIRVPLPKEGEMSFQLDGFYFGLYRGTDWIGAVCGLESPPETILWEVGDTVL